MPLRRLVVERKKKSKKLRPPRIYKRKGVKYIRPGKNKIKVSDVNLIINNTIASRSRGGYQRGYKNYKGYQKKAKDLMETKEKLQQVATELSRVQASEREAQRVLQIKEESLQKSEALKQAERIRHRKAAQALNDRHASESAEMQAIINDTSLSIDDMKAKAKEYYEKGKIAGILEKNAATAAKNKATRALNKEKVVKIEEGFDETPRAPKDKIDLTKAKPMMALAAADDVPLGPDEEAAAGPSTGIPKKIIKMGDRKVATASAAPTLTRLKIDEEDDEAIPSLPTITETDETIVSQGKKHGGPHGMSNFQIDAAMEDEPMYLKTISADQISDLDLMANLALDEYKQCGFIVNVDPRGVVDRQHWTAVYIDCDDENVCYYYDSFGDPPTPMIAAGLKALISKLYIPHYLAFEYNNIVNQDINSNRCGIHCILTLTELFSGMSTEQVGGHCEGAAKAFQYYI